jgi:hypothetical protein
VPPLSVYVHLPWCVRKCPYCDFNSHEAEQRPFDSYFRALHRELDRHAPLLAARPAGSLFFGGGTPSLTPPALVAALLARLRELGGLAANAEITLEANPGTLDLGHLPGYRAAGVNRLSLGIQSFSTTRPGTSGPYPRRGTPRAANRRGAYERLHAPERGPDARAAGPGPVEDALADVRTVLAQRPTMFPGTS